MAFQSDAKSLPAMMIRMQPDSVIYWVLFKNQEAQNVAPEKPEKQQNNRRAVERVIHIDPVPKTPRHHHHEHLLDHLDHPDHLDHLGIAVSANNDSFLAWSGTNQNEKSGNLEVAVIGELLQSIQTAQDTVQTDQSLVSMPLAHNQLIESKTATLGLKNTPEPQHNMWSSPLRRHTMLGGEAAAVTSRPAKQPCD